MKPNVFFENDTVVLRAPRAFTPNVLFESGQCFRFYPKNEEKTRYGGVAHGHYFEVELCGEEILFPNMTEKAFSSTFRDYFDLDFDYDACILSFPKDEYLRSAVRSCGGMRILHQEPFETLCSFILSQNNNIPRIRSLIEALCAAYGEPIPHGEKTDYSFPSAEVLASASEAELRSLKVGFRAPYLLDAARKVADGTVDFDKISALPTEEGLHELCKIKGVGVKVASCVLLFAFRKYDSFPIDVWMKKILSEHYPPDTDGAYFGPYAGIAQQYLFHYERNLQNAPHAAERKTLP